LPADDSRVEVLLPMAHPYERQASITNLEGRVQRQEGGASPPGYARADWSIVVALARRLGVTLPEDLDQQRAAIVGEHPALAEILTSEALIARV
jgi:NADH-quinone oxidoreductase subunit G